MDIREILSVEELPYDLLAEADPSQEAVDDYTRRENATELTIRTIDSSVFACCCVHVPLLWRWSIWLSVPVSNTEGSAKTSSNTQSSRAVRNGARYSKWAQPTQERGSWPSIKSAVSKSTESTGIFSGGTTPNLYLKTESNVDTWSVFGSNCNFSLSYLPIRHRICQYKSYAS